MRKKENMEVIKAVLYPAPMDQMNKESCCSVLCGTTEIGKTVNTQRFNGQKSESNKLDD